MKILLVFALGFIVISQQAILEAQEAGQRSNQGPAAPALPTPPAAPSVAPAYDEYLINPGDVLDVYVYDVPELSHTYTVSPSGFVTVPLLPTPVRAAGLTPDQFARAMEEAFRQSGRLKRPEIAVSVKQSLASSVAVEGAVKNPLILPEIGENQIGRYSYSMWRVSRRCRDQRHDYPWPPRSAGSCRGGWTGNADFDHRVEESHGCY